MTGMEIAAIIAAATTLILGLLGLFGGAAKYIVSTILDAYRQQSKATADAQDRDLEAKDRLITKLETRCQRLDQRVDDQDETTRSQRAVIDSQQSTIRSQAETIRDLTARLLAHGESA